MHRSCGKVCQSRGQARKRRRGIGEEKRKADCYGVGGGAAGCRVERRRAEERGRGHSEAAGTQRHSKWSENQICSLSPPPTSIATHLPPVCRLHSNPLQHRHPRHPACHPIARPSGPVTGPPSSPPSRPAPRKLERAPPFDPADSHPPRSSRRPT